MSSSDPIEETVQQSLAIIKRGIDELLVEAELAALKGATGPPAACRWRP